MDPTKVCARCGGTFAKPYKYSRQQWEVARFCSMECTKNPATPDTIFSRITVDESTGCWNWTQALDSHGYGVLGYRYRVEKAHRFAYEIFVGPIPEGLTLDHLCRNTRCVNPEHLEPVTQGENVLRGVGFAAVNARKTHCIHGHPLEGDNLGLQGPNGTYRYCLTCRRITERAYNARRPARVRAIAQ
jgi:hypothetical protein